MRSLDNFLLMKPWMFLLILTLPSAASKAQPCTETGWFGDRCQYKCHCTNDNCDQDGDCATESGCVKGWFGPQCQYADLMYTNATAVTPQVLRDGNDGTCITNQNLQSVTSSLTQAFPFTWMRLRIKNNDINSLLELSVQLHGSNGGIVTCSNMRKIPNSANVLDVYCDGDVAVQSFTLTGDGVKSLCTVNFSGGRNIALKERATQSSVYIDMSGTAYSADLAVDGNFDQNFNQNSCAATDVSGDSAPYWRIDFTKPRIVTRYVLYNRQDCCASRLKGFTLTSYAADYTSVFTHQDQEIDPQSVYTVTSAGITTPVSYVVIKAGNVDLLHICEVEIYGDSVCEGGMYGRECSDTCRSSCGTTENICEVSTGACSHCQPGMTGGDCSLACPSTYHGSHCQERCSTNCVDQICDRVTGFCVNCPAGKQGNLCEQDCPPTKYGVFCLLTCSNNCLDQLCDRVTGECDNCINGKTGSFCDQDCPAGSYGVGCTLTCSTNCTDQLCNPVSGKCNTCPVGKTGDFCDLDCGLGKYGSDCSLSCNNCKDIRCDPVNGSCADGCKDGYTGLKCEQVCDLGRYGPECNENCSISCNKNTESDVFPCHHVTGSCTYGCRDGYTGARCDDTEQNSSSESGLSGGAGVGIGLGAAAVIALVGVAIYCYRRKSSAAKARRRETPQGYDPADPTTDEHKYSDLFKSADDYNLPTDMASSATTPNSPPDNTTQDTVQYVNADVGQYEDLDEMEAKLQGIDTPRNVGGETNPGYANL